MEVTARPLRPVAEPRPAVSFDDLLTRAGAGDRAAFDQLWRLAVPSVVGLCRRLTCDDTEAEDVSQEVFLEVWMKAARFDPARGSAVGWISRIAQSRSVDRVRTAEGIRRRDVVQAANPLLPTPSAYQVLEKSHDVRLLQRAVDGLSGLRREALRYAFFTEYTHQQASVLLGVPLGTFKSRVRDALQALRPLLTDAG